MFLLCSYSRASNRHLKGAPDAARFGRHRHRDLQRVEDARWPAYEPIDGLADLEADGLERPVQDWRLIRLALEKMPDDALAALCAIRRATARAAA